jgi:YegS/Rv2252/BmrU family lipid kinase
MKSLAVIIGNPAARKSSLWKIESASVFLEEKGFATETFMTAKRGDAENIARSAIMKKPSLLIAAGGDGTINEVLNGVIHTDVPVALLPLGTTNVLARELSISENIKSALEVAISRAPKLVSLGKIELSHGQPATTRYFCLMAGIGFDGKTVLDVNKLIKKFSGRAAYILSGLKNFITYSPSVLSLHVDGREFSGYCSIIGKSSRYGGDFRVTPDSDLLQPQLYACIFHGRRRSDLLRYVFGVIRGTHLKNDDVTYVRSDNIAIYGNAHVQIDGDYMGVTPAKISVEKEAARLVF